MRDIDAAYAALVEGRLEEAEAIALRLLVANPEEAEAASVLGAIALNRSSPLRALEWLGKALAGGLSNVMVLCNSGEAHRRLGQFEPAMEFFEKALKLDNLNPLPHYNMGLVMRQRGNAPLAEHFFRSALLLDESMGSAHFALAELYRDEGHVSEAEAEYVNALACDPGRAEWHARLGRLQLERGATPRAVKELEEAARLAPLNGEALLDLARAQFEMCDEMSAIESLVEARRLPEEGATAMRVRVVAARRNAVADWCEQGWGKYTRLARQRWLAIPAPTTIPEAAAKLFPMGIPLAPEAFCARMGDVEVLPGEFSVLSADRQLFVDGLVNWAQYYQQRGMYVHHQSDDMRVLLNIPAQVIDVDASCILLGGGGDAYSWMFETLPRLWSIEQQPDLGRRPLLVPDGLTSERLEMLAEIGIGADRLLFMPMGQTFRVRDLIAPSLLCVGDWVPPIALQFLRRKFGAPEVTQRGGGRYFLSRGDRTTRRLLNQDELLPVLQAAGFETIDVAATTPLKLIGRLRTASALISIDDEALANLPVVPQGAWIGAITSNGLYRPRAHLIASQLGQNLVYLVGESRFGNNQPLEECDIVLPAAVVDEFVKRIG